MLVRLAGHVDAGANNIHISNPSAMVEKAERERKRERERERES